MGPDLSDGTCSGERSDQTVVHHTHGVEKPANHQQHRRQAHASDPALKLSLDDILQHGPVERQISNDPLQSPVLVF